MMKFPCKTLPQLLLILGALTDKYNVCCQPTFSSAKEILAANVKYDEMT